MTEDEARLLRRAGNQRQRGEGAGRRDAANHRPRAGRDRAQERHDRLDGARERARAAARAGEAHPAQVRLSAGQAGEGDADGAGAGRGVVGGWVEVLPSGYEPEPQFRLRIVQPRPEDRYVTCVPFVPLKVAAGAFSHPQYVEDENWEWVEIKSKRRLRPGMFVAQVVGKSMEPAIPDGSYCLFAAPFEGSRQGKTVLVQLRDAVDPETGERYTVKRYESEKVKTDGSWHHAKITLKPVNPEFESIELTDAQEGQLQVIAECIEVLGSSS